MNQVVLVPMVVFSSILLLSAPVAVNTADTCIANLNSTACCSADCGWFECTNNATSPIKVCMNRTDQATINKTCSGSTNAADLESKCAAAPTGCSALNETTCCSGLLGCGLFKCDTTASCWNSSDVDGFKASCESINKTADLTDTCAPSIDTCSTHPANSSCCSFEGCGLFMCKDTEDKQIGNAICLNNTTVSPINCTSPATPKDTCHVDPTPAPVTTCDTLNTSKDTCCNTTGISCQWLNCTGTRMECRASNASTEDCKVKDNICIPPSPSPITTPAPSTLPPTTQAPTPAPASNTGMQHFDGASFVGGIILAVGVIAIGFFGCKFYKARKERNYHTL